MVSLTLSVVELNQEGRPVNAIVVLITLVLSSHPGEEDFVETGFSDLRHRRVREFDRHPISVFLYERDKSFLLLRIEFGRGNTCRLVDVEVWNVVNIEVLTGSDVIRSCTRKDRHRLLLRIQRLHE